MNEMRRLEMRRLTRMTRVTIVMTTTMPRMRTTP